MKRRYILLATLLTAAVVAIAQYPDVFPRPYPDPYPAAYPGGGGLPPVRWVTPPTDQSVNEGATLAFSIAAKRGGLTVMYTIGANDSGAVNASTGEYTWTPSYVAAGTYTVTFTATAGGKTLSKAITVTVNNVDITLAGSVTDSVWATNLTGATVMAVGVDTATVDGDGNYSLTLGDPGVYTIVATHTADYDTITVTDTTITAPVTRNILIATYGQHVKGPITSNTTWYKALSPYRVDGNITVSAGTLTIEPGVTVKADSNALLSFTGTSQLKAIGAADADSIIFTQGKDTSWQGLSITGANQTDTLKYVRISNAKKSTSGGGIFTNKTLVMNHCTLRDDTTTTAHYQTGGGGAAGVTSILNSRIYNNVLSSSYNGAFGGGLFNCNATDCEIFGNSSNQSGGGISGSAAKTLTRCNIYNNTSTGGGGAGVYGISTGVITLDDCNVYSNTANASSAISNGGAAAHVTATNSKFYSNSSTLRGSGTVANSTLTNCEIYDNTSNSGGWYLVNGAAAGAISSTLTNCIVRNNVSLSSFNDVLTTTGGGISSSTATNCLIIDNYTQTYGGGAANSTLTNCTLWGNGAARGGDQILARRGKYIYNTIAWDQDSTFSIAAADTGSSKADTLAKYIKYSNIYTSSGVIGDGANCINTQPLFADSASASGMCGWALKAGSAGENADSAGADMGVHFDVPVGDTTGACEGAFLLRRDQTNNQLALIMRERIGRCPDIFLKSRNSAPWLRERREHSSALYG